MAATARFGFANPKPCRARLPTTNSIALLAFRRYPQIARVLANSAFTLLLQPSFNSIGPKFASASWPAAPFALKTTSTTLDNPGLRGLTRPRHVRLHARRLARVRTRVVLALSMLFFRILVLFHIFTSYELRSYLAVCC